MDKVIKIKKEYNDNDILKVKLDANMNGADSGHLEIELEANQELDLTINGKPYEGNVESIKIKLNGSIEASQFLDYVNDFWKKSLQ